MATHTASPNLSQADPRVGGSHRPMLPIKVRRPWPAMLRRTRLIRVSDIVSEERFNAYLAARIRGISPYYSRAHVSTTTVSLESVYPISRTAQKRRYRRALRLVRLMRQRGYTLFEPCLLRYRGESSFHLALPPVVERRGSRVLVVDGVHRLTALARARHPPDRVYVVLIRGENLPPPAAVPGKLEDVALTHYDPKKSVKFRRLKPALFRPAGARLRSGDFSFRSIGEFVAACERPRR